MKKLLVMLGIVATTAFAHGGYVYWTCLNVYEGNTTDKSTGVAYFMTTSQLTRDSIAALAGTGADAFTAALGTAYSYTPSVAGTYSIALANSLENETLGVQEEVAYTSYLVVFNTSTITDASKFYITNEKTFTPVVGVNTASVSFGTQKTNSQNPDNWYSVGAVPEPASVGLLLMGLCALGLKRKLA